MCAVWCCSLLFLLLRRYLAIVAVVVAFCPIVFSFLFIIILYSGIGYDCPPYENPGDYFMKIIHIKDPNKPTQGLSLIVMLCYVVGT